MAEIARPLANRGRLGRVSNESSAFHLERGARIDKLTVGGNVAGRDVVIGVTPADAEQATDRKQVLELLERLEAAVAKLEEAPPGLRDDAADELRKAKEAGQAGDTQRLAEKLETAHSYLERIASTLPAALSLAQAVAMLAQRIPGLT
jgi:hypothetical protein